MVGTVCQGQRRPEQVKNKHMTINERIKIQIGLDSNHSFKKIAEDTGKDYTSISWKVRKHITVKRAESIGRSFNDCVYRKRCSSFNQECTNDRCNRTSCAYCKQFCMTALCQSYVKETCGRLKKAPYICSGCSKVHSCQLEKHFYNAKESQQKYETLLSVASAIEIFDQLKLKLGHDDFIRLLPVILTDNGSEFSDPAPIEMDKSTGEILTQLFYCDPNMSQQKGACENNHEFIRRIIPKGRSMNPYSQEDIDLMMSHINSYLRTELGGKSPYNMFEFRYGKDILDKLNIMRIDPRNVILKPELLTK